MTVMEKNADRKGNRYHASDFYYAVQISALLLKPIGAWPLADHEDSCVFKVVLQKLSIVFGVFCQSFTLVPWILCIVREKWGTLLILRTTCPFLFTFTTMLRYFLLLWHRKQLKFCIDRMAEDWRNVSVSEDRQVMLENAKMGRTFGIISVAFMFSCGVLFYVLPVVSPNVVLENNVSVRLLPIPSELIVLDTQASPVYEVTYFLQFLSGCNIYSTFCGICSLIAEFVTHVCGQCDVLVSVLNEVVDGGERNAGSIHRRIATVIARHLRVLKFVSNIRALFTEICLMEIMNASCNICLLLYCIVTDLNNNESFVQVSMYLFGLLSIVFNVFMFCYIGDLLADRCQKLAIAYYAIEWYRMPPKKAMEMILPITMSRCTATLTAGKMMRMSMTTFSDIIKTSMAYFNLLRQFSLRSLTETI